jgi:hypothetical protein
VNTTVLQYLFVILHKYYKTVYPDVLRELWRAHVGVQLYGKSPDLCSVNFGMPKERACPREGRQGKGRAARQGNGGKAREGRQGKDGKARDRRLYS